MIVEFVLITHRTSNIEQIFSTAMLITPPRSVTVSTTAAVAALRVSTCLMAWTWRSRIQDRDVLQRYFWDVMYHQCSFWYDYSVDWFTCNTETHALRRSAA